MTDFMAGYFIGVAACTAANIAIGLAPLIRGWWVSRRSARQPQLEFPRAWARKRGRP
jgi:hypothetical protein